MIGQPVMLTRDCEQVGHCNHEPDGALYTRHKGRKEGDVVTVHCCWCGATHDGMPVWSKLSAAPPAESYANIVHGDKVKA